jgi:pimeloyl-ACP methyl ester carboxylesterase
MWVGSIRYAVLGLALASTALLSDCSSLRPEFAALPALPPTPAPIPSKRSGEADANGISIHYAVYGKGPPVLLLHGGLANADYWGHQIPVLARRHTVIAMDSRGHGRSTRDARPLGYDLMADDAVALLDVLKVAKTDVVGWSDGATIALDMAMRYPDRVRKIFAFAAATATSGEKYSAALNPNFVAFVERTRREYETHSPTPTEYGSFIIEVLKMWTSEPNWSDAQLKTIAAPVLVVEGAEDEAIKREHTEYIASVIPRAELLVLPNTSHFAFLQNPDLFNRAILRFLGDR